ncbi:MAG: glucose-6-phosphate dehydrogenase [Thiotrichaceae bacterium]|nr:glucose-6-phosphate dehydrogenase [Thiotrichaceae bacterium]
MKKPAENCTFVIFGATGNLAKTKLIIALYHLYVDKLLPKGIHIVGLGRSIEDKDAWIASLMEELKARARGGLNASLFKSFCDKLHYFKTYMKTPEDYQNLKQYLEQKTFSKNIAFYFSLPPSLYAPVTGSLGDVGLLKEDTGWRRVVVEKPFGSDLESSRDLQRYFERYMDESQIYRIDHYLGKETVQNVQVFRFANLLLEPLWNRNYIDHVQISHSETIGIGSRSGYYDRTGALRDMIQSHLLQLLSLVAMEPPVSMQAEDLRNEKVKLLRSISPIPKGAVSSHAFRAQYTNGLVNDKEVKSYLEEEGIPEESACETYAALKLHVNNWRWRGVPFYLRTGKRMAEKRSMVAICFRQTPKQFFRTSQLQQFEPNWLLIGIQPDETLRMELTVKKPGLDMKTKVISMDACFSDEMSKDAYEGLLLDVMEGDHTLFLRSDEVEESWKIVDPVLRSWGSQRDYIQTYPAGSWGPDESLRLFEKESQKWRCSLEPDKK